MLLGFQATQSGQGARTPGSRAGRPGSTSPSAASTRSTVDSDACTRPSREAPVRELAVRPVDLAPPLGEGEDDVALGRQQLVQRRPGPPVGELPARVTL